VQKDSVEVSLLVNAENGQDLAFCKIKEADKKTTIDVFNSINEQVQKIKRSQDTNHKKRTFLFNYLPTFLIGPLLEIMHFIINNLGLSLKALGSEKYPFGSLIITNVGSYGYENLYAPFPSFSGVPILFTVGCIVKKPKVVNDEIMIRECINISFTIDHRYTDGSRAIRLLSKFKTYIHDPEKYLDDRTSTWEYVPTWKA
jgi:2-oxoacid dehydrogenases acyltransferase (catalytic domain)